jgi:predicted DNA-binding protein
MSRFSITFEKRAAERLERLAHDGRTKSDVIREALVLEELFQEAEAADAKLVIRAKDGTEREIVRA